MRGSAEGYADLTRRTFLVRTTAAGTTVLVGSAVASCDDARRDAAADAGAARFRLDPRQRDTLRALCDRLIPADDDPGATAAGADAYIEVELGTRYFSEARDGLVRALDGLDAAARAASGGGERFADLDSSAQDALLRQIQLGGRHAEGWRGEHTLEIFLSLTLEGFLGHPVYGGNRDEVGWRMIGFHRCGPQPRPTTIRADPAAHVSLRAASHPRGSERVDAVIVGSGAGGAPVAQILAEAGLEVLILEKGPWYTKRDFVHDEIGMARRDFFVPRFEDDPHVFVEGEGRPRRTNEGWTSRCVGGGTVHMSGFFFRMHPEDFRLRTLLGEGALAGANLADWPIGYDDLAPHYRWVERVLGVSGAMGAGQVGDPLPLPPLEAHPFARLLDENARHVGARVFPTPRAVLSRSYGGRPPCTLCGFCGSYGCENDSKSTSLSVFLPRALATGRCRVRPGCQAREVLVDGEGRAGGVRYLDADGGEHEVRARIVVLACSAVETARLLLLSDRGDHPRGLANSSGLVGRNLVMSTFGNGEAWLPRSWATDDLRRAVMDSPLPFLQRSSQSWYWDESASLPHPKGGTIVFMRPHPNPIHAAEHTARGGRRLAWGSTLKDRLRTYHHRGRIMQFEVFGEFLPTDGTRVTLDPDARDRFGVPAARVTIARHEADAEIARHLVNKGLDVLEAAGCSHRRTVSAGGVTSILQGGTCRFGRDAAAAVLDADCQAFDVPNLYVTDGSFMPTSGGVPITLTIMANAVRVARRIVERGRRREQG